MKTKLNIYCLFIFVIIAIDLMLSANLFAIGFTSGSNTVEYTQNSHKKEFEKYHVVSLLPTELTDRNAITITDKTTNKTYKAWPTQLSIPATEGRGGQGTLMTSIMTLISLTFGIIAIVAFIRFVLNINRSKIFTRKNTKCLKRIGWCMLIVGIVNTIIYSADEYNAMQTFNLTGYTSEYSSAAYTGTILFGLFSLVIAEAFAIGVKMKEEQELII